MNFGIIGSGFVGSAVRYGFSPNVGVDADVKVYDKNPSRSTHTLQEVVVGSDIIFLSVPTPSNKDGTINLDIVEESYIFAWIEKNNVAIRCPLSENFFKDTAEIKMTSGIIRVNGNLLKMQTQLHIMKNHSGKIQEDCILDAVGKKQQQSMI